VRISVITSTWRRHAVLLKRCIPSVLGQTLRPIEHIVISDGPDHELATLAAPIQGIVKLYFLPEHSEQEHWGVIPRREGVRLATGEWLAFLDDDNAWRPQHLSLLADAVCSTDADFAYSRAQRWRSGVPVDIVGEEPPEAGRIDTSLLLARRQLFAVENWEVAGYAADWDIVRRWLDLGASYAFVPEITLDYFLR